MADRDMNYWNQWCAKNPHFGSQRASDLDWKNTQNKQIWHLNMILENLECDNLMLWFVYEQNH